MGSIGNASTVEVKRTPDEIVRSSGIPRSNRMQKYEINGVTVKTNYRAYDYPKLTGNESGYREVPQGKTTTDLFNELVERGYTEIRFGEMSTRIRGYHHTYYKAKV